MKKLHLLSLLALALVVFAACGDKNKKRTMPVAGGKPYEIVLVASHEIWDGPLGDSLRVILEENIPVFNSAEPMYSVVRILPAGFRGNMTRNRNIILVNIGSEYETPNMLAQYDVYAAPQLLTRIVGPDIPSVTQFVSDHRSELVAIFEIAERDRDVELNRRYPDKSLSRKVADKFGFELHFDKGWVLHDERNKLPDSVMWISREYPFSSQGIVIYSYPYRDRNDFTVESLISRRNQFVRLLPGETEGSHMTTVAEFTPLQAYKRINGRDWIETRGFWEVYNDFMGGPFVSYTTLDAEKGRILTLDFYVYSPDYNYPKRNFYRNLQHLIYGVSFPADRVQEEAAAIGE